MPKIIAGAIAVLFIAWVLQVTYKAGMKKMRKIRKQSYQEKLQYERDEKAVKEMNKNS